MIINQVVAGSGGSAPAHYIEKSVDGNGKLINKKTLIDLTGVTDLGSYVLYSQYRDVQFDNNTSLDLSMLTDVSGPYALDSCFYNAHGIVAVDLSGLLRVSGTRALEYAFEIASDITSIDVSSLTTITGQYALYHAFGYLNITSIDLSSLTSITAQCGLGDAFHADIYLTSVDISSLTTISAQWAISNTFLGCIALTSVSFDSLTEITGSNSIKTCFQNCTNLATLYFPSVRPDGFGVNTNQFTQMLSGVTGCTVHFPSNAQAKIETMSGYPNFSGTNTTVLFDLPATNTLTGADSNTYSRNPKYDTATSLAWKVGAYGTTNFTPAYYTSGTTDPSVSDAIYSDAACTQSVTTITAIS